MYWNTVFVPGYYWINCWKPRDCEEKVSRCRKEGDDLHNIHEQRPNLEFRPNTRLFMDHATTETMEINFGPTREPEPTTVLLNRVTDGLCAACHKLFHNIAITRKNTDRKPRSFTEIQRAGRAGCTICRILLASWNLVYTDVSCADCGTFYQLRQKNFNHYVVEVARHGVSNSNMDTQSLMMVVPAPSGPNPCNDEAPPSNSGSDQCFQLMNTWLRTCLATHSNCIVPSGPWVPTRLVDVGELASPKIILTAKMQDRSDTRYATLSHRWGDNVVRLTTGNLEEFQRLLPITGMSRTFLDAFVTTRKLGMRYIWIDSLCILQDSEMDWQVESAQMGQVYQNSLCNFSATAASDGNQYDGLFQERDPTWGSNAEFPLPNSQEEIRDVYRVALTLFDRWQLNVTYSALHTRGWVIQERFLSPRTVYFASGEIFWECRTDFANESYPEMDPRSVDRLDVPIRFKLQRHSSILMASGDLEPQKLWRYLTLSYCDSELTKETDRLMALAGVARAFSLLPTKTSVSTDPESSYLAGLWKYQLPWNLCWRVRPYIRGSCRKAPEYRAPSWSWTSLNFQRVYLETSHDLGTEIHQPAVVQVLSAQVIPQEGFDEFGPLVGGCLRLKGHAYEIDLDRLASLTLRSSPSSAPSFHVTGDRHMPFEFQLDESRLGLAGSLRNVADCCLPIFVSRRSGNYRVQCFAECLLLKQDKRPRQPTGDGAELSPGYARVGILRISLEKSNPGGPLEYSMAMDVPEMLSGVVTRCRSVRTREDGEQVAKSGDIIALY